MKDECDDFWLKVKASSDGLLADLRACHSPQPARLPDERAEYPERKRDRLAAKKLLLQLPTPEQCVVRAVAEHFRVYPTTILVRRRHAHRIFLRQLTIFMCTLLVKNTAIYRLAKRFGYDHSTFFHGVKKVEERLALGGISASDIDSITKIYHLKRKANGNHR